MPLVSMRQLLDHAAENGYGLPAFNVNNLEQIQAIMEAARRPTARSSCRARPAPANTPASPTCAT
jgi:fructose-bisphosphate aldolase class II